MRPLSPRRFSDGESAHVIALFGVEGSLLRGSDVYSSLLENRALADDLLALPRALTLRAACGYDPVTSCSLTARIIRIRGRDLLLRGRFVESPSGADVAVALTLSAAPGQGPAHPSEVPAERPHRVRRTRPSRHTSLSLRRPRKSLELRR